MNSTSTSSTSDDFSIRIQPQKQEKRHAHPSARLGACCGECECSSSQHRHTERSTSQQSSTIKCEVVEGGKNCTYSQFTVLSKNCVDPFCNPSLFIRLYLLSVFGEGLWRARQVVAGGQGIDIINFDVYDMTAKGLVINGGTLGTDDALDAGDYIAFQMFNCACGFGEFGGPMGNFGCHLGA